MKEYTLCVLKPDSVARGLECVVVRRVEDTGLSVRGRMERLLTLEDVGVMYLESMDQPYYPQLVKYMTSGPSISFIIRGFNAVDRLNDLVGSTDPAKATVGTIRRQIGQSILMNSIHSSNENRVDNEICQIYRVSDLYSFINNL